MRETNMKNELLIGNNFLEIPQSNNDKEDHATIQMVGTILNNMSYYGFVPSAAAYTRLITLSEKELTVWWKKLEPAFKEVTGANRNMDEFVVYKNFPQEVLEKSEAEYWVAQVLMYWGLPNEIFTEDKKERPKLKDKKSLKVLSLADENTLSVIYNNLIKNTARWSDKQDSYAKNLLALLDVKSIDVDQFSFKENGITIVKEILTNAELTQQVGLDNIHLSNATDVLRLAAAMSEGDVSLRVNTKFKKFTRAERRFLLKQLNNSKNLVEDFGLRKGQFKKLLANLHPGDYSFEKVKEAYNELYNNKIKTLNSVIETKIIEKDNSVLELLQTRPGEFFRRLHHMYGVFNKEAIHAFGNVIPQLKTIQLAKLDNYLATINERENLLIAPKGNWSKAKLLENKKVEFSTEDLATLRQLISTEIGSRLDNQFPNGIDLDPKTADVKLQTNDQKLASYGRGTVFTIPESMKFIRSASYWQNSSNAYSTWFDNGWNFFDENWTPVGTCCWNHTHEMGDAAAFSGDPTNSKELKGRACQMIDLYLDKLEAKGVKYAVWNVLAYSNIPFSNVDEVLATLQWGEKAETGKLFEPSRAQMVFPLTGENKTKYVAYIDVKERKLVYMDANLYGNVSSAGNNTAILQEKMPAYLEYLKSLPSVADVFAHAKKGSTPILYTDENRAIEKEELAYVFQPKNANNDFVKLDLSEVLDGNKIETIEQKKSLKKKF